MVLSCWPFYPPPTLQRSNLFLFFSTQGLFRFLSILVIGLIFRCPTRVLFFNYEIFVYCLRLFIMRIYLCFEISQPLFLRNLSLYVDCCLNVTIFSFRVPSRMEFRIWFSLLFIPLMYSSIFFFCILLLYFSMSS